MRSRIRSELGALFSFSASSPTPPPISTARPRPARRVQCGGDDHPPRPHPHQPRRADVFTCAARGQRIAVRPAKRDITTTTDAIRAKVNSRLGNDSRMAHSRRKRALWSFRSWRRWRARQPCDHRATNVPIIHIFGTGMASGDIRCSPHRSKDVTRRRRLRASGRKRHVRQWAGADPRRTESAGARDRWGRRHRPRHGRVVIGNLAHPAFRRLRAPPVPASDRAGTCASACRAARAPAAACPSPCAPRRCS